MDRLLAEEMEKQWQKRQDQWDKEYQAKVKLLHEVYQDREQALHYKQNVYDKEQLQKEMEKDLVTKDINKHNVEVERKHLEEIMKSKQHQNS